jgi:hypothetical protein
MMASIPANTVEMTIVDEKEDDKMIITLIDATI